MDSNHTPQYRPVFIRDNEITIRRQERSPKFTLRTILHKKFLCNKLHKIGAGIRIRTGGVWLEARNVSR